MRPRTLRPAMLLWLMPLLWVLGAATGPASAASVSSLLLDSEPGEFIGNGEFAFFTSDDGDFRLQIRPPDEDDFDPANHVALAFVGRGGRPNWSLDFAAPPEEPLAVGAYEGAVGVFRQGRGQPGLLIYGNARACINTSGSFEVKQVSFDPDGILATFWATFEQNCAGSILRGEIRFNADVPVVLRAPSRRTTAERHSLSFEVQGLDAQGDPVVLSVTGLPQGASFTDGGNGAGRFEWTPEVGQAGVYWLAFHGQSDGGDDDVVYTRIEVIFDFDDFDRAIPFSTLPFVSMVVNTAASPAADDPVCFGPVAGTVWYAFTPLEDARVYVSARTTWLGGPPSPLPNAMLSVYTGERGSLAQIACGPGFEGARIEAIAGRTYYFMVGLPPGSTLRFSVEVIPPPPSNDDFDAATVVETLPFSETLDTRGATPASGDPGTCGNGPGFPLANVWYAYSPVEDTRVTVDTAGSDYSTLLTVFTGTRGSLLPVGCDLYKLSFTAYTGHTYYLMVTKSSGGPVGPSGSPGGPSGSLAGRLVLSITGMPALRIQMAVDADAAFDPRSGTAIIHGTATCSRPAQIVVDGRLHQYPVAGDFRVNVVCDGATTWRIEVTPALITRYRHGRFAGGRAQVSFHAIGVPDDNPDDAASTNGLATVMLRGTASRELAPSAGSARTTRPQQVQAPR